jgi:hypothetical protein
MAVVAIDCAPDRPALNPVLVEELELAQFRSGTLGFRELVIAFMLEFARTSWIGTALGHDEGGEKSHCRERGRKFKYLKTLKSAVPGQ